MAQFIKVGNFYFAQLGNYHFAPTVMSYELLVKKL